MEARPFKFRFDHIADQSQDSRLSLEQLRLGTGMLHQPHQQALDVIVLKILFDNFLCRLRVHNTQCASNCSPTWPRRRAAIIMTIQIPLTMIASEHMGPRLPST